MGLFLKHLLHQYLLLLILEYLESQRLIEPLATEAAPEEEISVQLSEEVGPAEAAPGVEVVSE